MKRELFVGQRKKRVDFMSTMKDVAARAGVSIATVSNVLTGKRTVSPEVQRSVLKAIDDLNYHVNTAARGLKMQRTNRIGILLPDVTKLFYNSVLCGIMAAAGKYDYNITMFNSNYNFQKEKQMVANLYHSHVDAIILDTIVGCQLAEKWGEELLEMNKSLPMVTLMTTLNPNISSITVDCIESSAQITQHLIDQGCRRIYYLSGPQALVHQQERLQGYKQTLQKNGLPVEDDLISYHDFLSSSAYLAVLEALDSGMQFDAIQASNDQAAVGALKALKERGIAVPAQVAVTGYDGLFPGALVSPAITTVRVPGYTIGYEAVEECIRLINDADADCQHRIMEAPLVLRGSSTNQQDSIWELDNW